MATNLKARFTILSNSEQGREVLDFSALYEDYRTLVRGVIFRISGSEDLDDLVQDCFVKIWKALPKFKQLSSTKTWVYRIAANTAMDYCRKKKPYVPEIEIIGESPLPSMAQKNLVERGLEQLNEDHRAVLVLSVFEELSISEVAEILNLPTGTVKSRLHYGRKKLAKFLKDNGVRL